MSQPSKIEWTDATWNPVTGCTKVSAGCDHCYAETFAERWRGVPGHPYEHGFDLTLRPERLRDVLKWKRPRTIFVNSMSDLFHVGVPDDYIREVFAVMREASQHRFQVLTKRAERMERFCVKEALTPNIWLGVSVENEQALWRVEHLRRVRNAAVRFLSCEPLIGPLRKLSLEGIDWVIVGGESGRDARPMNPWWVCDIRDACHNARVPFFFKQWGEYIPFEYLEGKQMITLARGRAVVYLDGTIVPKRNGCLMERVGKKRAGRILYGRTHDGMPQSSEAQK